MCEPPAAAPSRIHRRTGSGPAPAGAVRSSSPEPSSSGLRRTPSLRATVRAAPGSSRRAACHACRNPGPKARIPPASSRHRRRAPLSRRRSQRPSPPAWPPRAMDAPAPRKWHSRNAVAVSALPSRRSGPRSPASRSPGSTAACRSTNPGTAKTVRAGRSCDPRRPCRGSRPHRATAPRSTRRRCP